MVLGFSATQWQGLLMKKALPLILFLVVGLSAIFGAESLDELRKRAEAGDAVAQFRIGARYDMGVERTGAVLGTVLALEGFSPQRVACGIADAVEAQQPEWAGPRFPDDLAIYLGECLARR